MDNNIAYNPSPRECIFTFIGDVQVTRLNRVITVKCAELTPLAVDLLKNDPSHVFEGKEVLFIDRVEDYYATHHFNDKVGVRVTKEKWS